MKKGNCWLIVVLPFLLFGAASCSYYTNPTPELPEPPPPVIPDPEYIGSENCEICHQEVYNTFIKTGHPYVLPKVVEGAVPEYPFTTLDYLPSYFSNGWDDVSYVIGGFAWKYNFIDQNGFIYTGNDAQYNFQDGAAVPFHADLDPGTKKYDCGRCHTTGWVSVADGGEPQGGLAGMDGEFFTGGVQCEACHGMGSVHRATLDPEEINVGVDPIDCQRCHHRNSDGTISAMDGFIRNYSQREELSSAGHKEFTCVQCHNPHISVKHDQEGGILAEAMCTQCHTDMKNPTHNGADCLTCHLPYATRSATSTNKYVGDVKTHIFKINPNEDGEMFNEDGTVANGETGVTLGYVCYQCHKDSDGIGGSNSRKSLAQLAARATGYHD